MLRDGQNCVENDISARKLRLQGSQSSKAMTYVSLNPTLSVHNVYSQSMPFEPEYRRTVFSRFRVSAHKLRIETGRWQRLPREERICDCVNGGVQDEIHVLTVCEHCRQVRERFQDMNYQDIPHLMTQNNACKYVYECMDIVTSS